VAIASTLGDLGVSLVKENPTTETQRSTEDDKVR
jgi:hypothetical protein